MLAELYRMRQGLDGARLRAAVRPRRTRTDGFGHLCVRLGIYGPELRCRCSSNDLATRARYLPLRLLRERRVQRHSPHVHVRRGLARPWVRHRRVRLLLRSGGRAVPRVADERR